MIDVVALVQRIHDLEVARDHQAQIISQFRQRGQVPLTIGEHTVYGTSNAVNELRKLLKEVRDRDCDALHCRDTIAPCALCPNRDLAA